MKKIVLSEQDVQKIIREVIAEVLNNDPETPDVPAPAEGNAPSPSPTPAPLFKNWTGSIGIAINGINDVESTLTRFNERTAQMYGLSPEKMQIFGEIRQSLENAKNLLSRIVQ